ncbi:MAG: hypothetical protein G8345_02785 [Magnetococcales bacterium]|nr:hypothetical protein [Magnetococcales bacterium]NGZ25798.1 hypothetical protein [Magnetococcales bacterium]
MEHQTDGKQWQRLDRLVASQGEEKWFKIPLDQFSTIRLKVGAESGTVGITALKTDMDSPLAWPWNLGWEIMVHDASLQLVGNTIQFDSNLVAKTFPKKVNILMDNGSTFLAEIKDP